MGIDIKQFVQLFDSGAVDKRKLKDFGPDLNDMMDVFRKLAEIKK
jgi:hypothetical protein